MPVFYTTMSYKPNSAHPIVTLTSDFGLSDAYVAAMKGAILRACPSAMLVDVTHNVPPGDLLCGSISLERAVDGFGAGAVHLAVVDPGVGSDRRILLVEILGSIVICPDNGLITWLLRRHGPAKISKLIWKPAKKVSDTFHGRDIMGPVAGMLAAGKGPTKLGQVIDDPILLDVALAKKPVKLGEIIHIDHFGNATTNIARESLTSVGAITARVGTKRIGSVRRTYADVASGKTLALFGSAGLLEIAVRDGSAAQKLRLRVGDVVTIDRQNQ
jgi:S-adenosyl-L-methionine hydrolase (adenosine-forming)